MKTQNEKTIEVINSSERVIYYELKNWATNICNNNLIGDTLIELISENSLNSNNKTIALNSIESDVNLTKEEAIELTYEISNNKTFYIDLMGSYNDKCKSDAFEVLRDIYPSKSDSEINAMIK